MEMLNRRSFVVGEHARDGDQVREYLLLGQVHVEEASGRSYTKEAMAPSQRGGGDIRG